MEQTKKGKPGIFRAEACGVRMDYLKFGSGDKTFVILPGLAVKSVLASYEAIASAYQAFAEEYTVFLFDRPKDLMEGLTVMDLAEDTAKIMQSLGIQDTDMFGASQGGMIAMLIAVSHPGLVRKLAVGSSSGKASENVKGSTSSWIRLAKARDTKGLAEASIRSLYSEETADLYHDVLVSSFDNITEEELDRFILQAKAAAGIDILDRIPLIRCPMLVIGSFGDRVTGPMASYQIAEKAGCELFMYGRCYGHAVYDEAPDYRDRLLAFFRKE